MLLRDIQDGGQNGVWNMGHSMSTQPECPGWPFYLVDSCTKYSMAFWEVISKISTLYSHWLPRYEQFSIMGVGRFLTRLRNRATKGWLQASVSSPNNLLHRQNCHPTVNWTKILQKCTQSIAMCYGIRDIATKHALKFVNIFPYQLWDPKMSKLNIPITLKHFISFVSFVLSNKMQLKDMRIMMCLSYGFLKSGRKQLAAINASKSKSCDTMKDCE